MLFQRRIENKKIPLLVEMGRSWIRRLAILFKNSLTGCWADYVNFSLKYLEVSETMIANTYLYR